MLAGSKNCFVVGVFFSVLVVNGRSNATIVSMTHAHRIESNWGRSSSLFVSRHSAIRPNRLCERVMMERLFRLV